MTEIVISSAARTAIGTFGGALKDTSPIDLATIVAKAAIERAGISPERVGQSFFGNVIHTEARDMYLSRAAAVAAGVPTSSPALTMNRLCGSGLQAVVSGIQALSLGECDTVLCGGAENMTRSGHLMSGVRHGVRMGDAKAVDMMIGVLTDPFGHGHMGVTAENIADRDGISRGDQDAFALESHRRAAAAIDEGRFEAQIVPVTVGRRGKETEFLIDEHVRRDVTADGLAKLRPAFKRDGSVTAGNASGINDGAAALVLMTAEAAANDGASVLARVRSYAVAGVDPEVMGLGPVPAMELAMTRAGLTKEDLAVIESNEAFAAQACAVTGRLGLDPAKVNPNGGAVALGHPIGASGAIILTKLVHELRRIGGGIGAATMCIGGGQGIAVIVEVD